MRQNNLGIFIFFMLLLALQSCGQTSNKNTKVETYNQFRNQKIELRDSLYILYTIKEWGIKNWYSYPNYSRMYKITNDEIDYFIGGTFYSPDKKKIMVWVGEKVPNAASIQIYNKKDPQVNRLCPDGPDTVYMLSAVIGFRDDTTQTWKLYPFDQEAADCSDTKEKTINALGQYYFVQMKTHEMYRMMQDGPRKGHKESQVYGYNLQDKDFWDKCWLFQKDTVGSYDLYTFQIYGYYYHGDKCTQKCAVPYNPPVVNYPEEILSLYKKE
jgi:hypothetical protein